MKRIGFWRVPSFRIPLRRVGILWFALVLPACAQLGQVPTTNILMYDRRGETVDPTGNISCNRENGLCRGKHTFFRNYPELDTEQEMKYIEDLLTAVRMEAPRDNDGVRRVLIYVHGGLNTQKGTIERAIEMQRDILNEAETYPIFINWQSSLFSSYFEHLLYIRQGKQYRILGPISSPAYLVADAARAVSRMPIVWGGQLISQVKTMGALVLRSQRDVENRAEKLAEAYRESQAASGSRDHPGAIAIETGRDDRNFIEKFLSGASYIVLLPVRMFVSAPIIDGFGTSSWDAMMRRTRLMFRSENEFGNLPPGGKTGGLTKFMLNFKKQIEQSPDQWEITLVGHSMGTIVLNEIIRRYPVLPYTKIIYMAAACSIADLESSVIPYLETHPKTQFYSVSLNRTAEERERFEAPFLPYVDPAIRGSLLSWIDLFLAHPLTFTDRTAGKFSNFVRADQIFPEAVRAQVHLKEFSMGNKLQDREPQKHGEFAETGEEVHYRFWRPEFYQPK